MRPRSGLIALLALLMVGWYGYRAIAGVRSGVALARGRLLVFASKDAQAIAQFDSAKIGFDRVRALREASDARLRLWSEQVRSGGLEAADARLLSEAAADYLEYLCLSPASWRPWQGLAQVYYRIEEVPIEQGEAEPPSPDEPWVGVGRAGRVAVGLLRMAIEAAPNWYSNYDALAMRLGRYGLEEQALDVVRESARVLPLFGRHDYRLMPDLPPTVLGAFAEGAREALDGAPVLTRVDQLIDLAKVEWRRGELDLAIEALEEALRGGDALNRAEAHYLLGSILRIAGKPDEARSHLEQAAHEHVLLETPALASLASMAQERGQPEEALRILQRLRWKDSHNLDYCLESARVAREMGNWEAALEALKWAALIHGENPRPRIALIETYVAMGDLPEAGSLLRELEAEGHEDVDFEALRRLIQAATEDRQGRAEIDRPEP